MLQELVYNIFFPVVDIIVHRLSPVLVAWVCTSRLKLLNVNANSIILVLLSQLFQKSWGQKLLMPHNRQSFDFMVSRKLLKLHQLNDLVKRHGSPLKILLNLLELRNLKVAKLPKHHFCSRTLQNSNQILIILLVILLGILLSMPYLPLSVPFPQFL